ncbi:MAG: response regulator transcription factor [Saprospiraceae bacterium]
MKEIKVLLADDHQILLEGIVSFLEKNAEEKGAANPTIIKVVGAAQDGMQALEIMKSQAVDVAVLDINMPGFDGLETARQIRRLYPATKIILLTMEGEGRFILNALRTGVHGYVIKEKSTDTLIQAIRQVYHGSTYYLPELLGGIGTDYGESPTNVVTLTEREREILCYVAKHPDRTAEEIGQALHIAMVTVQTHVRNIKQKLKMKKSGELVKYAVENKLCP